MQKGRFIAEPASSNLVGTERFEHSTPCTPCAYLVDFYGYQWTLTDRLNPSKYGEYKLN